MEYGTDFDENFRKKKGNNIKKIIFIDEICCKKYAYFLVGVLIVYFQCNDIYSNETSVLWELSILFNSFLWVKLFCG